MKTDDAGRLILTCNGTTRDLEQYGIVLEDRLALTFYMDDADDSGNQDELLVNGVVEFDEAVQRWVAVIDETTWRHVSEESASG